MLAIRKIILQYLISAIFIASQLIAQVTNRIFETVTKDDGLTQNSVISILQDKYGIMWFGTEAGLNKYDGYTFTHYVPNPNDPTSLSHRWINILYEDKHGNIWVGTNELLNVFQRSTDSFVRYKEKEKDDNSIHGSHIYMISGDSRGNIWVGTDKGLNRYEKLKNNFERYSLANNSDSLKSYTVQSIYEDRDGYLWIGTERQGLFKFDYSTETFTNFNHNPLDKKTINDNNIRFTVEDDYGNFWVGLGNSGLDKFYRSRNIFEHYQYFYNVPQGISSNRLRTVNYNGGDIIWIGTLDKGLNSFNVKTEVFTTYKHDKTDNRSLSNNIILSLCKDKTGILWVGTSGGGVNKSRISYFQHIKNEINKKNTLSNNLVWSFLEGSNNEIYAGTSGGFNIFDSSGNYIESIQHNPNNENSLSQNTVWSMAMDSEKNIWLGTSDGLNKVDLKTNKVERIYLEGYEFRSLSLNRISTLLYDSFNLLWLGTSNGLYCYDMKSNSWEYYSTEQAQKGTINSGQISAFYEDEQRNIWIGTRDAGLNRFDRITKSFISYSSRKNDLKSLSNDEILSITGDGAGNLWIGTARGLNKFNISTENFEQFHKSNDLPDEVIYGVVVDDEKNIWISTNYGISRFNTETKSFKNFTIHDGLQNNEFNVNAYYNLKDGRILFGGINGFNIFDPRHLAKPSITPLVKFTSFSKFGKEVELSKPIYETEKLILTHNENYFSIEFAIMDYTVPSKNSFSYKLEGADDRWINLGTKRDITFTNLASGEYNLMVKGKNSEGISSVKTAKIKLIVEPAYWSTWWFRSIFVLIIFISIFTAHKSRVKKIQSINDKLENLISKKTKDLIKINSQLESATNELATEKEELSVTLKSIAETVVTTSIDGKITFCNQAAEDFFNKKLEQLVGMNLCTVLNLEGKDLFEERFRCSEDDNYMAFKDEQYNTIIDGKKITTITIHSARLKNNKNKITGLVFVLKDISEKIKFENQLALSQKMESIGQLASGIAHEINTPMQYVGDNTAFLKDSFESVNSYIGRLKTLLQKYIPVNGNGESENIEKTIEDEELQFVLEEIPNALDQSKYGIERVSEIVKAMKDFAHPATKEKSYNNLNRGIEVTATISKNEWKYIAELDANLDNNLPNVFCMPDELNQVILNMIVNAAHAIDDKIDKETGEKGKISISTKQDGNDAIISISDTGRGIKEENLGKIFDPFFTTKSVGKGTGQGLAIVHDIIVNKHFGSIDVESIYGQGTKFIIKIPIYQDGKYPT